MNLKNGMSNGIYYNILIAVIVILLVLVSAIYWYKYKNKANKYIPIKNEDYSTNYNSFKQDIES